MHADIQAKYDAPGGLDVFLLPANDETLLASDRGRYNNFLSVSQILNRGFFYDKKNNLERRYQRSFLRHCWCCAILCAELSPTAEIS